MALKDLYLIKESQIPSGRSAGSDQGPGVDDQGNKQSPLEDGTPERDAYEMIRQSLEAAMKQNPNNEPTQQAWQMFQQAMQAQKPIDRWNGANNAWHSINDDVWEGGMTNQAAAAGRQPWKKPQGRAW